MSQTLSDSFARDLIVGDLYRRFPKDRIWGQTLIIIIIIRKCETRTILPKNASSQKNQQILSFQQKI
jgi:hypothetical protein